MTREEMIARGLVPEETKHSGHRRAYFHDYSRPGVYMLTLVTEGRKRVFGSIVGHTRGKRGTQEYPHLQCSALGLRILQEEIGKISRFYPMVEVWKVALMPDHLHLLVNVRERLPEGKHLGAVVRGFKTGCTRAWWKLQDETGSGRPRPGAETALPGGETPGTVGGAALPGGETPGTVGGAALPGGEAPGTVEGAAKPGGEAPGTVDGAARPGGKAPGTVGRAEGRTVPEACPSGQRAVLFQAGYHDRIIIKEGLLENICRYMDENPFRARLREECPNLMQRRLHLWIQNREYAAFGNLFLLKNPDKLQVFFHRKNAQGIPTYLTPEYAQEKAHMLQRAEEGAVLVTPGISKGEQGVVSEALIEHLPLIILQKEPITEYWKPSQGRFYACAAGRLLILAPWQMEGDSDYARFHTLNDLAREICGAVDTRLLAD